MELEKLKKLLGIPEDDIEKDIPLQFLMDDVTETICNYCNISALPQGLTNTAYRMAIDLFRGEAPGEGTGPMKVSSIKEGDTTTGFSDASSAWAGGVLKDYTVQLNRYRRLPK